MCGHRQKGDFSFFPQKRSSCEQIYLKLRMKIFSYFPCQSQKRLVSRFFGFRKREKWKTEKATETQESLTIAKGVDTQYTRHIKRL
jgi:hypothetical protein